LSQNDIWTIGPIPWFFDLVATFGNEYNMKRMSWLKMRGQSPLVTSFMRILLDFEPVTRTPLWNSAIGVSSWWSTEERFKALSIGGLFRSLRMRVMPCDSRPSIAEFPFPSLNASSLEIHGIEMNAESLAVV
jgi:hypothetical protein